MKIEELMINDLVMFDGEVYRVKGIYGNAEMVDITPYYLKNKEGLFLLPINKHVSLISPIPLTEEILEKNCWNQRPYGYVYERGGVPFALEIDKTELYLGECWDDDTIIFSLLDVHELQHALRLYGLTDLANNFQV